MSQHKYTFSTEAVNGDYSPDLYSINTSDILPRTNVTRANGGHINPAYTSPTTTNEDLFLTLAKDVSPTSKQVAGLERRQVS